MGWVKDKGGSAVQKLALGGKIRPKLETDQMSLRQFRKEDGGKVEEYKKGGKISNKKKNRTEKIGTAKLPEGAVLGKPETFPKYEKVQKPRLPRKGDKPKYVPMSKKKKK